jgi:hypothetical protein
VRSDLNGEFSRGVDMGSRGIVSPSWVWRERRVMRLAGSARTLFIYAWYCTRSTQRNLNAVGIMG